MHNNTPQGRHTFYLSKEWKNLRAFVIANEPLCRKCKEQGKLIEAIDCDHILSIQTNPELRLDYDNIQPLCKKCHSEKTFEEVKERIEEGKQKNITKPRLKWKT